jgi:hypothetical protein
MNPAGRYDALASHRRTLDDGRVVELRVPRLPVTPAVAGRLRVTAGERLDHLAARHFDDPYAWWRFADASPGVAVDDLDLPGTWLTLPDRDGRRR